MEKTELVLLPSEDVALHEPTSPKHKAPFAFRGAEIGPHLVARLREENESPTLRGDTRYSGISF